MGCFFCLTKMIPFLVCRFEKSTLSNIAKECFGFDFPEVYHKRQINYIYRYLKDLGAKSIVLEYNYVDKDYLDDFSRFYVRRFSGDGHKCARLHVFSRELNHRELPKAIAAGRGNELTESLQGKYLGFMVIKPLPKTFIGKTCFARYQKIESDPCERVMLGREYAVNFFGVNLKINSIAFQEQDKVVSACATTAIWSCLQALTWRSVREIPSCSQITTDAINFIDGSSNNFPSKELTNKQILRALDVEGVKHHSESLREVTQASFFRSVKCYIDSGIPLLLGLTVYSITRSGDLRKLAGHAVPVLGYRTSPIDGDAIYVHDDRLGPFARATFANFNEFPQLNTLSREKASPFNFALLLNEKNDDGVWQNPYEVLVPEVLIAATDRKVRLPLRDIVSTCTYINNAIEKLIKKNFPDKSLKLSFAIKLCDITEIKSKFWEGCKNDESSTVDERIQFLTHSFARLQWVAAIAIDGIPAVDILFDATDIPQGDAVSWIVRRSKNESEFFIAYAKLFSSAVIANPALDNYPNSFVSSFVKRLVDQPIGIDDYLDKTYGDLRAPKYLKPAEFDGGIITENIHRKVFFDATDDSLSQVYESMDVMKASPTNIIWVVRHDGALMLGPEIESMGHPSLTGFKPARIAGELKFSDGRFIINSKSGRYSGDYENAPVLLNNALKKFQAVFWKSRELISIDPDFENFDLVRC